MTPTTAVDPSVDTVETTVEGAAGAEDDVLAEVLVEEISIDGMCGVY